MHIRENTSGRGSREVSQELKGRLQGGTDVVIVIENVAKGEHQLTLQILSFLIA